MNFATMRLADEVDVMAPDGSEVRLLCHSPRGSMAHFTLPVGAISLAVAHRTVEEVWFFLRGNGRMWRRCEDREEIVNVTTGTSLTIPVGSHFQFRNDGDTPLEFVATTMPPWSGPDEAYFVDGAWAT